MKDRTIFKSKYFTYLLVVLLAFSITIAGLAVVQERQNYINSQYGHVTGRVTVQVTDANGKLVSITSQDAIVSLSYDFAACMMFGEALSSGTGPGCATNLLYPATTVITTATYSLPQLYAASLTGIALSTTTTQTNSVCTNTQTTNGLAPAFAGTNHVTGSNTPVASLSASWTFTGASVTIASVCLVTAMGANTPAAFSTAVIGPSSAMTDYAYENFAGQALTTSQSISVTWSFNM